MLTRKNEEFSRLIDQLHRDLRTRNHEYSELYGELDPIKKVYIILIRLNDDSKYL